ncbi:hypothetical protein [Sinomicrobium sp. M5D2P9]
METQDEKLIYLIKKAVAEYGTENNVVAIPGFLSKNFIAYCSMREDILLSLQYIEYLRTIPTDTVIRSALNYTLISNYGKCFTDASKSKSPKLEPSKIFENHEDFIKTHEFIMGLRHEFIAHRGKTDSEAGIAFMVFPVGRPDENTQIRFKQLKDISFKEDRVLEIEKLLNFIISVLEKKIEKCTNKIYKSFFELFTEKEISVMIMNGIK